LPESKVLQDPGLNDLRKETLDRTILLQNHPTRVVVEKVIQKEKAKTVELIILVKHQEKATTVKLTILVNHQTIKKEKKRKITKMMPQTIPQVLLIIDFQMTKNKTI
jgi:hypothetical protein